MNSPNWSYINDERVFESLMWDIIRQKDSQASIYDRRGKDAGIDARSGDGQTVYQAKYSSVDTNLVNVIKAEIDKIITYNKSSHNNSVYWKGVKQWCLYTNGTINPSDEKKLKEKIKMLNGIGIEVEIHHKALIDQDLKRYPSIKDVYFGGINRVFISLSEKEKQLNQNHILSIGMKCQFIGRENELNNALEFISSEEKICVVKGQGGVGKTRFVLELAQKIHQEKKYDVFWANTSTLKNSNNWVHLIIPSRKSLLIIDEPEDPSTVRTLLEQSSGSSFNNWKIIIISRSVKSHIFQPFYNTSYKEIDIKPLNKNQTIQLVNSIKKGNISLSSSSKELIYKSTSGLPVWIMTILWLIKKNQGKLSFQDISEIASAYFDEVIKNNKEWKKYIQAIAITQPVNVEYMEKREQYENFKLLIEGFQKNILHEVIQTLQDKEFLIKRGRLIEIKPDVMRDYIIFDQVGKYGLKDYLKKVLEIRDLQVKKRSLTQLARLAHHRERENEEDSETSFNDIWNILNDNVHILITKIKDSESQELNYRLVYEIHNILLLADGFSFQNPNQCLDLASLIINGNLEDSNLEGLYVILSEFLYGISVNKTANSNRVFQLFLQLIEKEKRSNKTENLKIWRQAASNYILKLIEYSHPLYNQYQDIIFQWINDELEKIDQKDKLMNDLLINAIEEYFEIERKTTYYSGGNISLKTKIITPQSKAQNYRKRIYDKIWSILNTKNLSPDLRKSLWKLVQSYHTRTNQFTELRGESNTKGNADSKFWKQELEHSFKKIIEYLESREINISEIQSLRQIWYWNLKHDEREKFKGYTNRCEELVKSKNTRYQSIQLLIESCYSPETTEHTIIQYIKNNPDYSISNLVEDCFGYNEGIFEALYPSIANYLFREEKEKALFYANSKFTTPHLNEHFKVSCTIITHHLMQLTDKLYLKELNQYWDRLECIEQKNFFLQRVTGTSLHMKDSEKTSITKRNIEFISKIIHSSFEEQYLFNIISFLAQVLFFHYNLSKGLIIQIFKKISDQSKLSAYDCLVQRSRYGSYRSGKASSIGRNQEIFMFILGISKNVKTKEGEFMFYNIWSTLKSIKDSLKTKFSVIDFRSILEFGLDQLEPNFTNMYISKDFFKLVDPIEENDSQREEVRSAIEYFLDLNNHQHMFFHLKKLIPIIDPLGSIVPSMIVEKINSTIPDDNCDYPKEEAWTRYACYYPVNSNSWRIIAKAACKSAQAKSQNHRDQIFYSLLDQNHSFTTFVGEVAPYFIKLEKDAREDFNSEEQGSQLKEFMKWRWELAEEELRKERNRVAEEDV